MWKDHPRLHTLWLRCVQWSICVEAKIEVTYFSGDDIHERERAYKIDWEIQIPRWLWRPYCWLFGHSDDSYGSCVVCEKRLYDYRKGPKSCR